jgi:hypothetical protein
MAKGKSCKNDGCEKPAQTGHSVCSACRSRAYRASRRDPAEHRYAEEGGVPEGFHLRGISELRGADGEVKLRWVKSAADAETRLIQLRDAVLEIGDTMPRAVKVKAPKGVDADLLCVYPMGDPHLGMYAWAAETGADFDLQIAERELFAAVDHLVDIAPPARQALILNLGDFFHADSPENRTSRSGHALDVDTRWPKVLGVGIRLMRRIVDRTLEKHERVRVVCEIGNHDDNSAIMLAQCLALYYEREPRVEIDTSPAKFHWLEFGRVLIGVTHGNGLKREALPGIMAADQAEAWGRTEHRFWYTGHIHHESVKEFPGVVAESFRTLAPRDAWHAASGYRSGQDMRCDILHRAFGRIGRHIVGISQVRALLAAKAS